MSAAGGRPTPAATPAAVATTPTAAAAPSSGTAVAPAAALPSATVAVGKALVVVIDDDTRVLGALRAVLQRHYAVETFADAMAGVDYLRSARPAAIILDIKMPVRDGFWCYHQVRRFNARVPILFNSAYQDAEDVKAVHNLYHPYAYLTKGGSVRDFLATVAAACGAPTHAA